MNNYSFGSKPDFRKLSLLWQLDRNRIRTGVASLLTEPLSFERDHNWHRQRRYLSDGDLRAENPAVFDFLHQRIVREQIDDVRCLAERPSPFRRTRFCFARYAASDSSRSDYFANLASDRRMMRRHLLFFDPTAGFRTALRPANPPADYLDFDDFRKAADAFPDSCLLVNNPYRSPVIDAQGSPTRNFRLHTLIANRLKFMLAKSDSLHLLHSPHNCYYLILRAQESVADRIIEACRRAKLKLHRCR